MKVIMSLIPTRRREGEGVGVFLLKLTFRFGYNIHYSCHLLRGPIDLQRERRWTLRQREGGGDEPSSEQHKNGEVHCQETQNIPFSEGRGGEGMRKRIGRGRGRGGREGRGREGR